MPQTGSLCHARLTDTDQVLAYCVAFSYSELIETSSLRHFKATGPFYLRGRTVDSSSLQGALTCSHRHIEDSKRIRHPGASGTSLKTSVLLATPFTLVSCSGISLRMMSGAKKKAMANQICPPLWTPDRSAKDPYSSKQAICWLRWRGCTHPNCFKSFPRALDSLEPLFAWQGEQSLQMLHFPVLCKIEKKDEGRCIGREISLQILKDWLVVGR